MFISRGVERFNNSPGRSTQATFSGESGLYSPERDSAYAGAQVVDLYRDLCPLLYSFLRSRGLDRDMSEDVVQDTFLRLLFHLAEGKGDSNIRAWIFCVAHNLSMDLHRSSFRFTAEGRGAAGLVLPEIADSAPHPEEQFIREEHSRHLQDGISRLTIQQRTCVLLRAEGLRYREIAQRLGISTQRVADLVRRGLKRLVEDA